MQVLMDESIVFLVYAVMLAVIIALFAGSYILYKRNLAKMKEQESQNNSETDKLTSA